LSVLAGRRRGYRGGRLPTLPAMTRAWLVEWSAANDGTTLRELSLDEAEMVGGGFSWGRFLHGVDHFGRDVEKGMAAGVITAGVAGALAGDGVGAAPGTVAGSIVGAVGAALDFLNI
jgi:ABC-type dipeptide/oligopeptide/nickel transport system permease subunit